LVAADICLFAGEGEGVDSPYCGHDRTRARRPQKKTIKGSVKVTVTATPLAAPQPVVAPAAPAAPTGGSTPHA